MCDFNTIYLTLSLIQKQALKYFYTVVLFMFTVSVFGQNSFNGILLCKKDSAPIPFAIVKSVDVGSFTQTNIRGEFHFSIPAEIKILHFEISAIGFHDTIIYHPTRNNIEKIYIEKLPLSLTQVTVEGLSAKETLMKAVDMIPVNYLDSSFASFSFFRQYEKVNGEFKNLIDCFI